eukprot:snap_masked-scaffold_15-processed-gene-9.13-mRNA-1 protein AED:1.00 eAED:1.00 QI:0/-1/0/0/-1/1/1/0/98
MLSAPSLEAASSPNAAVGDVGPTSCVAVIDCVKSRIPTSFSAAADILSAWSSAATTSSSAPAAKFTASSSTPTGKCPASLSDSDTSIAAATASGLGLF